MIYKKKIEFHRDDSFTQGYGYLSNPWTEEDVWDFIQKHVPVESRYLKHFLTEEFTVNDALPKHKVRREWWNEDGPCVYEVPKGTLIIYLTIYYETSK